MGERGERPGTWLGLPRGLRWRHAGAAASERPGACGGEERGRPRKEEGAWLRRRRRGADPASREGRPSPAGAPATQAGRRPSSRRCDPAEGGRGRAGRGRARLPGWPSLPVPPLPWSGVDRGDPERCAGCAGRMQGARGARLWRVGTRRPLAHRESADTPPPRPHCKPAAGPGLLFPGAFRLEGLHTSTLGMNCNLSKELSCCVALLAPDSRP